MPATLQDLYEAISAGASKATLLRLVEALEHNGIRVPPELRQEIDELVDLSDEEGL